MPLKGKRVNMASGRSNNNNRGNYPPPDLFDRRAQTLYRIQNEMNAVSKTMDQGKLNWAARNAGEKEREKQLQKNSQDCWKSDVVDYYGRKAAEAERARLVAEERDRRLKSGSLNVAIREKFIPSLEEKKKSLQWRKGDEDQKQRMVAMDLQAARETNKELGSSYRLSPSLLRKKNDKETSDKIFNTFF